MNSIFYKVWGFFRQTAIRIYVAVGRIILKLTGSRRPETLFCLRANAEKIGTDVKIISEDDYSTTIAKVDENGNIKDDDFVIVTSTDFHFCSDNARNKMTVEYFVKHVKEVKPDLVILTGDVILGKF